MGARPHCWRTGGLRRSRWSGPNGGNGQKFFEANSKRFEIVDVVDRNRLVQAMLNDRLVELEDVRSVRVGETVSDERLESDRVPREHFYQFDLIVVLLVFDELEARLRIGALEQ